jgi:hypothetical protein
MTNYSNKRRSFINFFIISIIGMIFFLGMIGCTGNKPSGNKDFKPGVKSEDLQTATPKSKITNTPIRITSMVKATNTALKSNAVPQEFGIKPIRDLDPQLIKTQLNYFIGGASGDYSYGLMEKCKKSIKGPVSLYISGVYSTKDQIIPYQKDKDLLYWGGKTTPCKSNIEYGDMVYFMGRGFKVGDNVRFTIKGPRGSEQYSVKVSHAIIVDGGGTIIDEFDAARFSWVATSKTGAGKITVEARGNTGSTILDFSLQESNRPNFGATFGAYGNPLMLTQGEKIKLAFTGFPPNHVVTTLIYNDSVSKGSDSTLVGGIETKMSEIGESIQEIEWPKDLPPGMYSLLVPELISATSYPNSLYSIQFTVSDGSPSDDSLLIESGRLMVINVDKNGVLNIYSSPDDNSKVIGSIPYNASDIQFFYGNKYVDGLFWTHIRYGEIEGWVNSYYLIPFIPQK